MFWMSRRFPILEPRHFAFEMLMQHLSLMRSQQSFLVREALHPQDEHLLDKIKDQVRIQIKRLRLLLVVLMDQRLLSQFLLQQTPSQSDLIQTH